MTLKYEMNSFDRKTRKYNSILVTEAIAKFSTLLGDIGVFDCRISELSNINLVLDYFRWRNDEAHRNALNAHCYWMLRKNGKTNHTATELLSSMTIGNKNELLFQNSLNFNDLPLWQKRSVGLYWELI